MSFNASNPNFATASAASNADLDAARAKQMAFATQLQTQAAGGGPSPAAAMLNAAADRNTSGAMGIAASQRGVNPGLALRTAVDAQTQGTQAAAAQGVAAKQQEQLNAQGMLGGTLGTIVGQGQQGQQANDTTNANVGIANQKANEAFWGGITGGLAGIGSAVASDEKLKKDIKPAKRDIQDFLDEIEPKEYSYKDPKNGKGTFVSPMAQDLEKTATGKSMVKDTPEGKMVDYGHGFGAILAAMAQLNERTSALESKKKGGK